MKKYLFPLGILLSFVSCTQLDEFIDDPGDTNSGDSEKQFMAIDIANVGIPSRADYQNDYEDGTKDESAVKSIILYFFNSNGASVQTTTGGAYTLIPDSEKWLEGHFTVDVEFEASVTPTSVIAILNHNPGSVNSKNDLIGKTEDFGSTKNGFVMSNSVYSDGSAKIVETAINNENFQPTKALAEQHPVKIYVERVVAKIRVNNGSEGADEAEMVYPTGDKIDGEDIRFKVLGWNVTNVAKTSRLLKEINPKWDQKMFGDGNPWNWKEAYRSFWAVNPDGLTYDILDFDDENISATEPYGLFPLKLGEHTYVQENAAKNDKGEDNDSPTALVIAGQLIDKNVRPIELAVVNEEKLYKDDLPIYYANRAVVYNKTVTEEDVVIFSKIKPEDIVIVKDEYNNLFYPQLAETSENKTWTFETVREAEEKNIETVNAKLKELGGASVYENGYSFHSLPIRHLQTERKGDGTGTGYHGVVRNHVYNVTVKSIKGIGNPTYLPGADVVITPGPKSEIVAEIDVLSWRVVQQSFDVELN